MAEVLEQARFAGDPDTILLLVSELVTNAVRHAGTPFDLTVTVDTEEVVVAVVDLDGLNPPLLRNPTPDETSGRGLRLVEDLATSWGSERLGGEAKRVWFRCS